MKRRFSFSLAFFMLFSLVNVCLVGQDKYAILIGVASYNEEFLSQLKYTEDDALGMASSLNALGFQTKVMTSQARVSTLKPNTPEKILTILRSQMNSCAKSDTIIISLSGHGLQFGTEEPREDGTRETYFCPEDADPYDKSTLLPISEVIELLRQCEASRKLLLIDACRNEFISTEGQRKSGRKLQLGSVHETKLTVPGGMTVMFSCSEKQASWEHDELQHSVFSFYVMEYLNGNAEDHYYDDKSLHLDGLTAYVRKRTNDFVLDNVNSAGQNPLRIGEGSDWILGQGINPVTAILTKHIEFLGGEANLRKIRTYDITGTNTVYYDDGTTEDLDIHYFGKNTTVVQTSDYEKEQFMVYGSAPEVGWSIVQGQGSYFDEADHWSNRLIMRYPFSAIEMLQRSSEFQLGDTVEIDGVTATELIIKHPKLDCWTKWAFDKSGRMILMTFPNAERDGTASIRLSDYREYDGVKIPMQEMAYDGDNLNSKTVLTDAEINLKLDAKIFVIPEGLDSRAEHKTNDEIDQLVNAYRENRNAIIESWDGFVKDIKFSREDQATMRLDYTLANGMLETVKPDYFDETIKTEMLGAFTAEEIETIRRGFKVRVVFKTTGGSEVCNFVITAEMFDQ